MATPTLFSHAEATALLTLVREVFARVRPLRVELVEEAQQLSALGIDPFHLRAVGEGGLTEQLARRRQGLHELSERVDSELAELTSLGIDVKTAEGLVDFCSLHDGRVVLLCWEWDEPEISCWHELEAGYAGRQPIEDPSAFGGEDPA